jgi:PAS domain S-box-containing protein
MRWSIEVKTSLGFAIALLLIALVGFIAFQNSRNFIETNQLVIHTREVRQELETTLSTILDAETGQRGYLLTSDEGYLDPYTLAVATIDEHVERLRTLTEDNPDQQHRLSTLEALVAEHFDSIQQTLQVYEDEGFESAQQVIQSGIGKLTMDEIRALFSEMVQDENQLLEARSATSTESAQNTVTAVLLLTGLVFGLLCFIYYPIHRDVVGRKRVEFALEAERSLLRTVIDTIPDYIYVKDSEGRFVLNDLAHARLMGAPAPDAVLGKMDFDMFAQEFAVQYTADERVILQTGQPLINREELTSDHAGNEQAVLTTKIPLRNSQNVVHRIVGITRDVTEQKRREREIRHLNDDLQKRTRQLEVANKELEAFTYTVSHDLRAPLRAIDGFSRLLMSNQNDYLSPDAARYLQRVRENAQKMGHLIDDLLMFSRLSRQPVKKQTVVVADIVRQALDEDLQSDRENRQVEIVMGDLPACQADPALLKQVLVNLLGNALKFTQKREVARREIGSQQSDGRAVYFVKDNGADFDMQYKNKLFRVFERLHQGEDYDGTGVGLAIVQRIIQRHGGQVWAEAEENRRATFYFTLGGAPSE